MDIKHIYSGYWNCDEIAFLSNEHIICGVLSPQLAPSHNRYMPYYTAVTQDPNTAYVFPIASDYTPPPGSNHSWRVEQRLKVFHRYIMDGYVIYFPR